MGWLLTPTLVPLILILHCCITVLLFVVLGGKQFTHAQQALHPTLHCQPSGPFEAWSGWPQIWSPLALSGRWGCRYGQATWLQFFKYLDN